MLSSPWLFLVPMEIVSALMVFQTVKVGFFPASTSPQIVVDYYLPEGAAIERTTTDMLRMEALHEQSSLNYTLVRPPYLTKGPPTGEYRTSLNAKEPCSRRF